MTNTEDNNLIHFGRAFRRKHFAFDPSYLPMNHGSYGAFPINVRDHQRRLQDSIEANSDPFIRLQIPNLLIESRKVIAKYLGADVNDVVLVPNATTAINTVLRNLTYESGDVILFFSFAYDACVKTVKYICESTCAQAYCIRFMFPAEDDGVVDAFVDAVNDLKHRGLNPKLLIFDTVVAFPGVRLPWERLVHACRENQVLSLVDGAHGIGHIDLTMLAQVEPDFFTSNCYKWLFTPRACAVFYVPCRNHHLIRSSVPTSHGYRPILDDEGWLDVQPAISEHDSDLVELFNWVATVDQTPYLCIPKAVNFRNTICGGEDQIRQYCFDLARRGGDLIAHIFGTEVMHSSTSLLSQCCFTNVRLPLNFSTSSSFESSNIPSSEVSLDPCDGPNIVLWITKQCMVDHNTWIPCGFYGGNAWIRLSAEIYLELDDFKDVAEMLSELCSRINEGRWAIAQDITRDLYTSWT